MSQTIQIFDKQTIDNRTLDFLLLHWKEAFSFKFDESKPRDALTNRVIFILSNQLSIPVAIGSLSSIQIQYLEESHEILGIGGILSTVKGKGYGKQLMNHIKNYIFQSGKIGIGFCTQDLTYFYQKSNFFTSPNLANQFYLTNSDKSVPETGGDQSILYINDTSRLIPKLLNNPESKILIPKSW